jgi:hypothetical protein
VFGHPRPGDGYKVSGEFVFADAAAEVFTIYDWKATSLYFGSCAPTPEEFWTNDEPFDFSVGATADAGRFLDWLVGKVNDYCDRRQKLIDRIDNILVAKGLDPSVFWSD